MANQGLIRQINRGRILNAIRLWAPLSRSEAAERLSLDRKSVTNLVGELLEERLVLETGKVYTPKGRPLTMLGLNTESNLTIGIAICEAGVDGSVLSIDGRQLHEFHASFPLWAEVSAIRQAVHQVFDSCVDACSGKQTRIGLAVPGILDVDTGCLRHAVNLPTLNGLQLRDLLPETASAPITIEHNARAKALAEKWFGVATQTTSFVCVDMGTGIGAGIIQNRRLYTGVTGYVGEIGHMVVERGGRLCRCGHKGCLEAYVSDRALLHDIHESTGTAHNSLSEVNIDNPSVLRILRQAGRRLGFGLSYLVNIVCPPLIVINGQLMLFSDIMLPAIRQGIQEGALSDCLAQVAIVPSSFPNAAAVGAGAAALSELFEVEDHYYI